MPDPQVPEEAVEAAALEWNRIAERIVRRAEPHLQRMYWGQFREAMLSKEAVEAAEAAYAAPVAGMTVALRAALNTLEDSNV